MRGHYIRDNKTTRSAGQHIALALDIRTSPSVPGSSGVSSLDGAGVSWSRLSGGKWSNERWDYLTDVDSVRQLLASIVRPRCATWLWCANMGQAMSLCGLWEWLDNGRFSLYSPTQEQQRRADVYGEDCQRSRGYLCLADTPTIISGWLDGKRLVMLDVRNWWNDYAEPDAHADIKASALMERVRNTVDLVRSLDIGVMKPTLASQSMQHWRHMPQRPRVLIPDSRKESSLARAAYFGARADCFWLGPRKGPIYHLDCNSMYGFIMASEQLPVNLDWLVDRIDFGRGIQLSMMGIACAAVRLNTKRALPFRQGECSTLYATGNGWTFLCGRELQEAAAVGAVTAFGKMATYTLGPTCQAFARYWLAMRDQMRQTGNKQLESMAKSMLCSLYGRWAAKRPGWTEIALPGEERRWGSAVWRNWRTGLTHPVRIVAGKPEADMSRCLNVLPVHHPVPVHGKQVHARDIETESSFPAISAFITAAARQHMDAARACAGERNVLYQCYDAIHVTEEGFANLTMSGAIDDHLPGAFKVAGVYNDVVYHGINCLRIDGKLTWAGLPNKFRELTDGRIEATVYERVESVLQRGPDGTVRMATGIWKAPPNPWGQYAAIGQWRQIPKMGE